MMISVDRFRSDDDATLSKVSVDGAFVCFGLEDEYRADKIAGETRIPAGEYPIAVRAEGGFHQRYAQKFPAMHRGMLHVTGVPGFTFVLIHIGNSDDDTAGCLLVGLGASADDGELRVTSSRLAYEKLYPMVIEAALAGDLDIEYIDNDRPGVPMA